VRTESIRRVIRNSQRTAGFVAFTSTQHLSETSGSAQRGARCTSARAENRGGRRPPDAEREKACSGCRAHLSAFRGSRPAPGRHLREGVAARFGFLERPPRPPTPPMASWTACIRKGIGATRRWKRP
jgi:hypothetical protein